MEQEFLKVKEAAAVLNISERRTYDLVLSGELRSVKLGRVRRVPVAAIREFADRLISEADSRAAADFDVTGRDGAPRTGPRRPHRPARSAAQGVGTSGDGNTAA